MSASPTCRRNLGRGARAYLDIEAVIAAAKTTGCDALHPGYGFLSENADLARRCAEGASPSSDRPRRRSPVRRQGAAKALAKRAACPSLPAPIGPSSLDEARAFVARWARGDDDQGDGGRRRPRHAHRRRRDDLADAYARCQSEAKAAFGNDGVYAERLIRNARHIEVQIIGDRHRRVSQLWERECTIQRRHQKLVEIAPRPSLATACAGRSATPRRRWPPQRNYDSLGTFEFLVDGDARRANGAFAFIEANPRLQVEHTVTEEVTGIDLVRRSLPSLAARRCSLGLAQGDVPRPRGFAMQLRVNMETMDATGATRPTGGTLSRSSRRQAPACASIRSASRLRTNPAFDSLLAKVDRARAAATGPTWCQGGARVARIPHRRRRDQYPASCTR